MAKNVRILVATALVPLGFLLNGCSTDSGSYVETGSYGSETSDVQADVGVGSRTTNESAPSDVGASNDTSAGTRGDGGDERPFVLTTFTVIADMARAVGGDRVRVEAIIKPGIDVHSYEPTPSDLVDSHRADLILSNGFGLEAWLSQFVESRDIPTATLSDGIDPITITVGEYKGKANPHAWMSPRAGRTYVDNIRRAFTTLVPSGTEAFAHNAATYTGELDRLAEQLRNDLAHIPSAHRVLASCEGAFSYLARDFDLREAYLWAVNQEGQGTARQLARLIRDVRTNELPAVFCESTVNPATQQQVVSETSARFGGMLYVDSFAKEPPINSYLALLRHDIRTIIDGLTT